MKMHIHCPGSMTDGLDSPSRGESRWTQNLAKLLSKDGHQIVVTGGGIPKWGSTKPIKNVLLAPEGATPGFLEQFGPFDLNIDSSWWEAKLPMVNAKKHLLLKWSLEDYTRNKLLPKDIFLCYPLNVRSSQFFEDVCVNKDKTFFLPLPFGPKFHEPNFNEKGLLWTCKDMEREKYLRDNATLVVEDVLYPLLGKEKDFYVIWLMLGLLKRCGLDVKVRPQKDIPVNDLVPYYEIRNLLGKCKLVVAVNVPGSVHDAAMLGVPTLEWERGGFYNYIARKHNVLIENGASAERINEVVNKYMYDEKFYADYVKDIQYELRYNTDDYSLSCFYNIMEKIF